MSALLDSLANAFHGDDMRRALLDEALHDGLPGPRSEAWKYTSLRALERRSFAPAQATASINPATLAEIPSPRMVFANGRYDAALSDLSHLPEGVQLRPLSDVLARGDHADARFLGRRFGHSDEVFARLNSALAEDGALLRVEAGVQNDTVVHLVFISAPGDSEQAWHLRNFIELRHSARLGVVEHHLAAGGAGHLGNNLTHVHLLRDAELTHARIQTDGERHTGMLRTDAVLARDARYQRLDLELGSGLSRHEFNARLEGDNARLTANGVLLGNARRHLDTRLGIEHIGRDTVCSLLWRGIADDHSRVVFHGGIHIREGADGTDASLSNKNLLLSANAEIDSQPVLVIDADEVKAAHGATVGQLDANALFYLRSRGLPLPQAQRMLTAAFCREPLEVVRDQALATLLRQQLDRALASAGVA